MASTALQLLSHPKLLKLCRNQTSATQSEPLVSLHRHLLSRSKYHLPLKCTTNPDNSWTESENQQQPERFEIEKRRKSVIIRDRKAEAELVKPEPENFEIGWKRTKEIKLEKPKGYVIADFLEKLEALMERNYGSEALLAKTGEIVAEKAREEAEVLRDKGEVEERFITELYRVLKLMEMDLAMVKSAVKEETLKERLDKAKARCRQAILVANSF